MPNIPLEAFGELFDGKNAARRFQQRNYSCPFDRRIDVCDKPNNIPEKYGNCSARVGDSKRIICPRRFYEDEYRVLREIKEFVWDSETKVDCFDEFGISMKTAEGDSFNYGNLDWILVNSEDRADFCGVEIQTDSTTGTGQFKKAIDDLLNGKLEANYRFGLNTLASFKGFLPQFIFKGQLFDDWKKPYCAVIQDELCDRFIKKFRIRYKEIDSYKNETFLFFVYSLKFDDSPGKYKIGNQRVYSSRWIDLLFSFSVQSDLLLDLSEIENRIKNKITRNDPVITF